MKQERIKFKDIMELGFTIEECQDKVYEDNYGFPYRIVTKDLTNLVSVDWDQITGFCQMIKIGDEKEQNITDQHPIKDLDELKHVIKFFGV